MDNPAEGGLIQFWEIFTVILSAPKDLNILNYIVIWRYLCLKINFIHELPAGIFQGSGSEVVNFRFLHCEATKLRPQWIMVKSPEASRLFQQNHPLPCGQMPCGVAGLCCIAYACSDDVEIIVPILWLNLFSSVYYILLPNLIEI